VAVCAPAHWVSRLPRSSLFTVALALAVGVGTAAAAPPSNDTCGTNGANAQPIGLGQSLEADTTEAVDDYKAADSGGSSLAPSSGPDIVFKVVVPAGQNWTFTVVAPFETVLYYVPDDATKCGTGVPNSVSIGHSIRFPTANTTYYVVVDGAGPADRGSVRASVSFPGDAHFFSADNALFGSIVARLGTLSQPTLAEVQSLRAEVGDLRGRLDQLAERTNTYRNWTFAAGSTRKGWRETLTFLSRTTQKATIRLFTSKGQKTVTKSLKANRPSILNVNKAAGKNRDVAIQVSGESALFVERTLRFGKSAVDVSPGEHD
jgi:hypothetical protein